MLGGGTQSNGGILRPPGATGAENEMKEGFAYHQPQPLSSAIRIPWNSQEDSTPVI